MIFIVLSLAAYIGMDNGRLLPRLPEMARELNHTSIRGRFSFVAAKFLVCLHMSIILRENGRFHSRRHALRRTTMNENRSVICQIAYRITNSIYRAGKSVMM
jgi:hypothetical protein